MKKETCLRDQTVSGIISKRTHILYISHASNLKKTPDQISIHASRIRSVQCGHDKVSSHVRA